MTRIDLCLCWLLLACATQLGACALERGGLGDSSRVDAGARDAGSMDAGSMDAGPVDAGPVDAGPPGLDAGPVDAGPPDSGPVDAGPPPTEPPTGGLVLHFDAQDVRGDGSTPGSSPITWTNLVDDSDKLCPATQYLPEGLSPGHPAIRTTGEIGSHCWFTRPIDADLTIFLVFRSADTRSAGSWFNAPVLIGSDMAGNRDDAALVLSGGQIAFSRSGGGLQVSTPAGRSYADDVPHLVALTRTAADGAVRLWVDGEAVILGSTSAGGITDPIFWRLSGHDDATDGLLDCAYGEVLVYDRALDEGEILSGQRYLRARWGL